MGEMNSTKNLIGWILNPEFKESVDYTNKYLSSLHHWRFNRLIYLAELAQKEIQEQEARERGEQK